MKKTAGKKAAEQEAPLRLGDRTYFKEWLRALKPDTPATRWRRFSARGDRPKLDFSFEVSSVYSSAIEGNTVDLNYFFRSKANRASYLYKRKEIGEIEALVSAYRFARAHALTEKNLLAAHALFAKPLLPKRMIGRYRRQMIGVISQRGLEYAAIEPEFVAAKMNELLTDARKLRLSLTNANEAFYHAALLHLLFVHIHPFDDGNGRAARLLEKWFLAACLGDAAWHIPSEAFYQQHRAEYYRNIQLGLNYYTLRYDRCVPFLAMLPRALQSTGPQSPNV